MALSLSDVVRHPMTLATALVGSLGGLLHVDVFVAVWSALWMSLGTLFPAVSITAFTLGPEVDFLPVETLKIAAIVLGALYVLKLLSQAYANFEKRL